MGLQDELGFHFTPPNAVQRACQHAGATRLGGLVFHRTLYRIDRPLYRWSRGRLTAPALVIGLPVIMLTTTGAKSGQLRTMPVAAIPYDEDLAVLGTNFAQPKSPGWAFNLAAHPEAEVAWHSTTVAVHAIRLSPAQMDDLWTLASDVYTGFSSYRERIGTAREVMGFRLVPSDTMRS